MPEKTKSDGLLVRMNSDTAKAFKVLLAINGDTAQSILSSRINHYIEENRHLLSKDGETFLGLAK